MMIRCVEREILKQVFSSPQTNISQVRISPLEFPIPEREKIGEISENINRLLNLSSIKLKFSVYGDKKDIIIQVIDLTTQKVIREIPSVKILEILNQIIKFSGILFERKI